MLDNVASLVMHLSDEELVYVQRLFRWIVFVLFLSVLVLISYWVESLTHLNDILIQTVSLRWGLVVVQRTFCMAVWSALLWILSAFPYATNAVWAAVYIETDRRTTLAAGDPIRTLHNLPLMVRLTMASKSAMGSRDAKRRPNATPSPFFN
jgi:hypothetical protein